MVFLWPQFTGLLFGKRWMSDIKRVCDTLKQLLKQKKLTYRVLAEQLGESEANIKRIFSTSSFSLDKLERICHLLEIRLSDLFLLADQQMQKITQLTKEQEKELVDNPRLFLVAVCVRDGWTFEDIIEQYDMDQFECIQHMARLDKLNMIQLLPENRYKLLIAQDFRWIKNGPLEHFIEKDVLSKFMASSFSEEESFRFYLRGSYSQASIEVIRRKLSQLTKEVAELNHVDSKLPINKRKHLGLLLAMRPWEFSLFEAMRRRS